MKKMTSKQILGGTSHAGAVPGSWVWNKSGGHPAAAIQRIREKLAKAGFKPADQKSDWSPVDNVTYSDRLVHRDGRVAVISRYYGATKRDNHFTVSIR